MSTIQFQYQSFLNCFPVHLLVVDLVVCLDYCHILYSFHKLNVLSKVLRKVRLNCTNMCTCGQCDSRFVTVDDLGTFSCCALYRTHAICACYYTFPVFKCNFYSRVSSSNPLMENFVVELEWTFPINTYDSLMYPRLFFTIPKAGGKFSTG